MKIKGIETASILPWYRVIIMNSITIDIQKLTLVKMSYGFLLWIRLLAVYNIWYTEVNTNINNYH